VKLEQHDLALTRRQARKRVAYGRTTLDVLKRLCAVAIGGALVLQLMPGLALPPAQLIQRGVTDDREQPRPRRAPTTVKTRARTVEALERKGSHILRCRAIAEQRDGISVHIGSALPEERLEGLGIEGAGPRSSRGRGILIR